MSKDNTDLRLLGSPVNLSYRSKKKSDKNIIRNRPRSALQNSCFTPSENQDKYKRPFSADTKERQPSACNVFRAFSSELLDSYHSYPITNIKVVPPTAELLQGSRLSKDSVFHRYRLDKDNASDYGSEDTFISLGTKIKARAQSNKPRNPNDKNFKCKNTQKKTRKPIDNTNNTEQKGDDYRMEVNITEKSRSPSPGPSRDITNLSKAKAYESYFIPLESKNNKSFAGFQSGPIDEESLAGRVSFGSSTLQGSSSLHADVEQAIDTYSRRLTMTKQQLSLVEEESSHDIDSPSLSHNIPSLSPEPAQNEDNMTGRNTYDLDNDKALRTKDFSNDSRAYKSFYDDFNTDHTDYNNKANTVANTDASSKDSGYIDSGPDKPSYKRDYSLPTTSAIKRSYSVNKVEEQPKSLDNISRDNKNLKTFSLDKKSQWSEPLNHSRLLYKDFFLKKEGHVAQPQNSPESSTVREQNAPEVDSQAKVDDNNENFEYPSYLLNSTTKAYTSKVIEDYKKELEAINNLHELTLKDIQVDTVSPTPFNIDRMFEQHSTTFERPESSQSHKDKDEIETVPTSDKAEKNILENAKSDISKVSTKELIQNYFKVKEGDQQKDYLPKNLQKYDKRVTRAIAKFELYSGQKQDWNNKTLKSNTDPNISSPKSLIRNQTQKNVFTLKTPTSARIESVQNDRDIDSWMSLARSPRVTETNEVPATEVTRQTEHTEKTQDTRDQRSETEKLIIPSPKITETESQQQKTPRPIVAETNCQRPNDRIEKRSPTKEPDSAKKDLDPNASVLDIYTMLKEIESFGDNPVTSVTTLNNVETDSGNQVKNEERTSTPKDSYTEIFEFLEQVEQSANDALSVVTTTTPSTVPKLEQLLKLPPTELAQRLVTASLQLDERSCCIALLQESIQNHKEQMIQKVSNLEKQCQRNISRVKQDCEETVKRHQTFIDQLINDKKTLNHRIEQLVDERRAVEERWKRSALALEERYKLELRNQHDKMAAAQQVARQRWVRQKAEKIKELTVKGLEGELREMAERQQKEVSDLKMSHAETVGRTQAKHNAELEELRKSLQDEKEAALVKERQMASSRLEKQILELELTYQEQRTRLVAEIRAENERVASSLGERERQQRLQCEQWKEEQEKLIEQKRVQMEEDIVKEKERLEEQMHQKQIELEQKFEQYKREYEAQQQAVLKKKVTEIAAQHKLERDREIEKAIESMEAEAQAGRRELQDAIRRNKEQYELELRELAETEQATLRRYQEAQARVRHTEDRCAELEVLVGQLETRNKVITEKNTQLEQQCEESRARCDAAWRGKIDSITKEMETMKKTHEEQMHQLYAKVKVAVARKDSTIQALTREAAKYQEKITLLEQKLAQQRKDFLKHK